MRIPLERRASEPRTSFYVFQPEGCEHWTWNATVRIGGVSANGRAHAPTLAEASDTAEKWLQDTVKRLTA